MAYSFAQRHDKLRTRMRSTNSRAVVYRRGRRSAPVPATVYELSAEELIPFGVPLDARRRDYIIDLAELETVGNPFGVPKAGDTIEDGGLVCQVAPLGEEACFRWTNHQRNEFRIHTQIIKET
jgi:hypothetical protein